MLVVVCRSTDDQTNIAVLYFTLNNNIVVYCRYVCDFWTTLRYYCAETFSAII